jgi:glycosyltransferase involved in cell wall biosynthesis
LKILFVSEYYKPHIGGVETVFMNLAEGMAKRGHRCRVITSRLPGTPEYEETGGVGIHRIRVPRRGDRYWFGFLAIPKVIKMVRQADIIQATTYTAAFPAWLAAELTGTKSIITVHEVWDSLWLKISGLNIYSAHLHRRLEKILISLPFDATVCVSQHTCNHLKKLNSEKRNVKVIYNGIDNALFSPDNIRQGRKELGLPEQNFIYMYYGRPGISKGIDYLVQAVPLISAAIPGSKLLLILSPHPDNRYKKIEASVKNRHEHDVILRDPVPDDVLTDYVAAVDCVVVPSLSEGFGFAAAEACAMGKPVVVSDTASLPEVVSGEYVLVEPGNPNSIADGVIRIFNGDVSKSARKVFDWDKCISHYLDVYQTAMAGT